ncbi:putative HTH-type transcriptional regulator [Calidithermus terrae]|uniref:Putative HTH-type transcriptional regulator n=1 Tax=Calidithermus terrae TaxID=1408545 RepID=A0A399EAU8_9DEIN|nr:MULTISPECIES: Rrf2 family transcriptional regulator [Calidithermus]RIH80946.1 putative HTH-type transcriptional regulator [Calidithermus terrae]
MRLSATDIYAFKALGYLANQPPDRFVGSEELSRATGVRRTYLVRILAVLVAQGLVTSKKGIGGGYTLPRPPQEINLRDVMRAIDGPIAPLACVSLNWPKPCVEEPRCHARSHVWMRVRDAVLEALSQVSVADLAEDYRRGVDYGECLEHLLHPIELLTTRGR